jgi:hypothetical protein
MNRNVVFAIMGISLSAFALSTALTGRSTAKSKMSYLTVDVTKEFEWRQPEKLQAELNEKAQQGWRLHSLHVGGGAMAVYEKEE